MDHFQPHHHRHTCSSSLGYWSTINIKQMLSSRTRRREQELQGERQQLFLPQTHLISEQWCKNSPASPHSLFQLALPTLAGSIFLAPARPLSHQVIFIIILNQWGGLLITISVLLLKSFNQTSFHLLLLHLP